MHSPLEHILFTPCLFKEFLILQDIYKLIEFSFIPALTCFWYLMFSHCSPFTTPSLFQQGNIHELYYWLPLTTCYLIGQCCIRNSKVNSWSRFWLLIARVRRCDWVLHGGPTRRNSSLGVGVKVAYLNLHLILSRTCDKKIQRMTPHR